MKLSIVATMYFSSTYINEFYKRITETAEKITKEYELILVNDGSPDSSLEKALNIRKKDRRVKVIDLSRNFGHHKAILSGLKHTSGKFIYLIDTDLEENPELLIFFWKNLINNKHYDVVSGVQERRKGKFFERWTGQIFYKLINILSDIEYPTNIITARLMTRRYVNSVLKYREKEFDLWTIFSLVGYNQKLIPVEKKSKGSTTYTFLKKIRTGINTITSSTSKPLYYVFVIGFFITLVSALYIIYVLIKKIFFSEIIEGWTSLIISIWFLGGLIMLGIGTIGIYLSKIFKEIKKRPNYIIRDLYDE